MGNFMSTQREWHKCIALKECLELMHGAPAAAAPDALRFYRRSPVKLSGTSYVFECGETNATPGKIRLNPVTRRATTLRHRRVYFLSLNPLSGIRTAARPDLGALYRSNTGATLLQDSFETARKRVRAAPRGGLCFAKWKFCGLGYNLHLPVQAVQGRSAMS